MAQNGGLRTSPYSVFLHESCRYPRSGRVQPPPGAAPETGTIPEQLFSRRSSASSIRVRRASGVSFPIEAYRSGSAVRQPIEVGYRLFFPGVGWVMQEAGQAGRRPTGARPRVGKLRRSAERRTRRGGLRGDGSRVVAPRERG